MSKIIGGKPQDYVAEQAPLGEDEYKAITEGTNGVIHQMMTQMPNMPSQAVMSQPLQLPLGMYVRAVGTLRHYRECLESLEGLSENDQAKVDELLHPAKKRVVEAKELPPMPSLNDLKGGQ